MSVYCVVFLRFYIYVQVRYMRVGHLAEVLGPGMHWAAFFSSAQGVVGQSWKFSLLRTCSKLAAERVPNTE